MLNASLTQTVKAAERELDRHAKKQRAPVVMWQDINEAATAFDARLIEALRRLPKRIALLGVCEPHPQAIEGVTLCELTRPMFEVTHPKMAPRYACCYGGRGRGGSWGFGRALIAYAVEQPLRIICLREFQNSISESVHKLLADQIEKLGLARWFDIQQQSITGANGSEFIFAGIRSNPGRLKSTEGIDIAYLEEAEAISRESWEILVPTVRKRGSRILVNFNPQNETDPTYERLVTSPPPAARVLKSTWRDNPWLSDELLAEKDHLARTDPDEFQHTWEGECLVHSKAQILAGKYVIENFDPLPWWDGPYIGLDFGFNDPTAAVCCYIYKTDSGSILYISHEAWALGCDLSSIPSLLEQRIPGAAQHVIRADSAWKQSVVHLRYNGLPKIESVEKWPNSVEEGIKFLRGLDSIVIHPRCTHTIEEARLYRYRVDRLTGDVLDDIVDKHNHCWDAVRYAIAPVIRKLGDWVWGKL